MSKRRAPDAPPIPSWTLAALGKARPQENTWFKRWFTLVAQEIRKPPDLRDFTRLAQAQEEAHALDLANVWVLAWDRAENDLAGEAADKFGPERRKGY